MNLTPANLEVAHYLKEQGTATPAEISEATGRDQSHVENILQQAAEEGRVVRLNENKYQSFDAYTDTSNSQSDEEEDNGEEERVENVSSGPVERVKRQYVAGEIGDIQLESQIEQALEEEFSFDPSVDDGFSADVEATLE